MSIKFKYLFIIGSILFFFACDSRPKVIESQADVAEGHSHEHDQSANVAGDETKEHEVVVEEVLHTDKYSYMHVSEGIEKYWVAIPKTEVEIGDVYFFKGGLLKKNFRSQEFNRVFETVYLVSNYWKKPVADENSALNEALAKNAKNQDIEPEVGIIDRAEGAISIADLINNKGKYSGKVVKVTGKCVKVNPMIMGRNWVHLKDGSDENLDLTITTTEVIALGSVVTLEGTITLDKDFGAGYRYDILMEGAQIK